MQESLVPMSTFHRSLSSSAPRFASLVAALLFAAACGDAGLNLGDDSSRVRNGEEADDDAPEDTDGTSVTESDAGAEDTGEGGTDDSSGSASLPVEDNPRPSETQVGGEDDLSSPPMSVMTSTSPAPSVPNQPPMTPGVAPIDRPPAVPTSGPPSAPMVPNPTGPDAAGMCPVGLVNCATSCVDIATATSDCGACGNVCAMGQSCIAGACTTACGDGVVLAPETCDDGNTMSGDGCDASCQVESTFICPAPGEPCLVSEQCGDGIVDPAEACDDGNDVSDDGCADCQVQAGWVCEPSFAVSDAGIDGTSLCFATCGDGLCADTETDGTCPEDCLAAD